MTYSTAPLSFRDIFKENGSPFNSTLYFGLTAFSVAFGIGTGTSYLLFLESYSCGGKKETYLITSILNFFKGPTKRSWWFLADPTSRYTSVNKTKASQGTGWLEGCEDYLYTFPTRLNFFRDFCYDFKQNWVAVGRALENNDKNQTSVGTSKLLSTFNFGIHKITYKALEKFFNSRVYEYQTTKMNSQSLDLFLGRTLFKH